MCLFLIQNVLHLPTVSLKSIPSQWITMWPPLLLRVEASGPWPSVGPFLCDFASTKASGTLHRKAEQSILWGGWWNQCGFHNTYIMVQLIFSSAILNQNEHSRANRIKLPACIIVYLEWSPNSLAWIITPSGSGTCEAFGISSSFAAFLPLVHRLPASRPPIHPRCRACCSSPLFQSIQIGCSDSCFLNPATSSTI